MTFPPPPPPPPPPLGRLKPTEGEPPDHARRVQSPSPESTIVYRPSMDLWNSFEQRLAEVVMATGAEAVGELGGGANPTAQLVDLVDRPIQLTVLDISPTELKKAPGTVSTLCVDLCAPEPPVRGQFDLVFSRMLCEHVSSAFDFHRNCHAALRTGGHAVHFFPTATALPFLVNRVIPESLGERVVGKIVAERAPGGNHSKFPARYDWCWGPTRRQIGRYRSAGFEVVSYDVGVGHHYYDKIPGLRWLEQVKSKLILAHPSPHLAAYALVVLRRK